MKQWYEELFENYGLKYDNEVYVHGTIGECDFFEKEIKYNKAARILDIGCGTGRHSIELAKRGYSVTGIDQSESLLKRAREKAAEQNVKVNLQRHDARNLTFKCEFDLVIMICEGGFSLMETDEMNFQILKNAANALRPKGKFIFTTLNGLFPLFHSVKDFFDSNTKEDANAKIGGFSFDLMTFREHNTVSFEDDFGNKKELKCNERYYVPCEINWLLKSLKFKTIDIYGARLGAFSRNDKLTTEDFEMLIVTEL
ncbi:MAG: class I SAM-dependent methyltransferase [Sedimentisphaerales bacterium]|nr:class I SAM-dependent methyltransferase [Sedimentisphaerales bacterium]